MATSHIVLLGLKRDWVRALLRGLMGVGAKARKFLKGGGQMKNHRNGGKMAGHHTTLIDLASTMVDLAQSRLEVKLISPGMIQSGSCVAGGMRKVKFAWIQGGLLMTIRQNRSVQEVRVFTDDTQTTMVELARAARNREIPIGFLKKDKSQAY